MMTKDVFFKIYFKLEVTISKELWMRRLDNIDRSFDLLTTDSQLKGSSQVFVLRSLV